MSAQLEEELTMRSAGRLKMPKFRAMTERSAVFEIPMFPTLKVWRGCVRRRKEEAGFRLLFDSFIHLLELGSLTLGLERLKMTKKQS
jgi:hypothetical protein